MNIVIADDEQIIVRWLKKNLEELSGDYHVNSICMNGKQVLNYCLNQKVDVLFTDIRMPIMDGLELLEKLKVNQAMPYTIVLSAYSDFSYVRDAFKLGASDYLLKTEITKESLCRCMEQASLSMDKWGKKSKAEDTVLTMENFLEQFFAGTVKNEERDMKAYRESFLSKYGEKYCILQIFSYTGAFYSEQISEMVDMIFQKQPGYILMSEKNTQELVFLIGLESMKSSKSNVQSLARYLEAFGMKEILLCAESGEQGIDGLENCWLRLQKLSENMRFFRKKGVAITGDNISQEEIEDVIEKWQRAVIDRMTNGTEKELQEYVEECLSLILKMVPSEVYLKRKAVDFLMNLYWNYISEINRKKITTSEILKLNESQNISEFYVIFKNFLIYIKKCMDEEKKRNRYSEAIEKVISYISRYYNCDISLNDLAEYVHLNRSYLSTSFKKEVGVNINVYLLKYRLDRAKEQLITTNEQVQQIGEAVGISDSAYFSKQFKKYTGESPLEYRKSHK